MKIIFVYYNPHPIHKAWADSVTDIQVPFISKRIFDFRRLSKKSDSFSYKVFDFLRRTPVALQPLAIAGSYKIPKADIYLAENATCLPAIVSRKSRNSKIILINDDIFFYLLREAKGIKKKFYLKYLKHVDGIISSSNVIKKVSQEFTDVPNKVNHAFVDAQKFSKVKANIKSKNIAFTGMLANQKRVDLIVRSFLKLDRKYKNKLYLIGPMEDKIDILEKNKRNKDIIITGWAKNPEVYLKKCGIYINPAEREAFGMNILEAMCAGIPPLVSAKCGASEIVAKVSKTLIIKQDVDDIIKKIEWLNDNPKIKRKLGVACKLEALKYTKEKSSNSFRKKFYELIDEIK